jgi:hypothetical protein
LRRQENIHWRNFRHKKAQVRFEDWEKQIGRAVSED